MRLCVVLRSSGPGNVCRGARCIITVPFLVHLLAATTPPGRTAHHGLLCLGKAATNQGRRVIELERVVAKHPKADCKLKFLAVLFFVFFFCTGPSAEVSSAYLS